MIKHNSVGTNINTKYPFYLGKPIKHPLPAMFKVLFDGFISCLIRDCERVQQKYYRFWAVSTASSSFLLDELKVTEPKKISPYYCLKTPSRFTKLSAAQIGHPWPSFALRDLLSLHSKI
jgi:hypothetical protein